MKAFSKWAVKKYGIDPPEFDVPLGMKRIPKAWSESELQALFAAAEACRRPVGGTAGSTYWPALLHLIWETAERIDAVHRLLAADIDCEGRNVLFQANTRKGGREDKLCDISPVCAEKVAALVAVRPIRPFAAVRLKELYYHKTMLLLDAGLPHDRNSKFHKLRRSHASHLHKAGGDATASLGHSSNAVTTASYIDPRITQEQGTYELLPTIGEQGEQQSAGLLSKLGRLFGKR